MLGQERKAEKYLVGIGNLVTDDFSRRSSVVS